MCFLAVPASFLELLQTDGACVALHLFGDAESGKMEFKMSCGNLQLCFLCDL